MSNKGGSIPFGVSLNKHGKELLRGDTVALQVNVGLLCNQYCKHCHLDAGPDRGEIMSAETKKDVIDFATRFRFSIIDVTGGAPELVPGIEDLVVGLAGLTPQLIFRSNLSALIRPESQELVKVLREHKVVITVSLPAINPSQTDAQRGKGIFSQSVQALKMLNELGYGVDDSGLVLNLVSNPAGAFLPQAQKQTEARFRQVLNERWGVVFNDLFAFANVPLGRFRTWLQKSGNLESYTRKLIECFNPDAIQGVMCRHQVSVSWDGYLYDCDFNQAAGLPLGQCKTHVSEVKELPGPGSRVSFGDHCYTCTAGAGFT